LLEVGRFPLRVPTEDADEAGSKTIDDTASLESVGRTTEVPLTGVSEADAAE